MDILMIKQPWGEKILNGEKTWEIRGSGTSKRGRIALAFSKTGAKYGEVELVDSIPLTEELWKSGCVKAGLPDVSWKELLEMYKAPYAWVMQNPQKYKAPVPFTPKRGAVIWVRE